MSPYILAVHLENDSWKVALLRLQEGKSEILLLKTLDLNENPLEALKTILHKKTFVLASALEAQHWVLRRLELGIKGWKNILAALPFQAEEIIPFPKEQTVLIPFLEEETAKSTKLRLIATKREFVENHIASMNRINLDPHAVTTTVHALKRFIRFALPKVSSIFLVYGHKEHGFAAFLRNGEIVEFKTAAFERPEQWRRMKEYFLKVAPEAKELPWVVLGNLELLGEKNPPSLDIDPSLVDYALPIGIALEAAICDKNSVQLRNGELSPPLPHAKREQSPEDLPFFSPLHRFDFGSYWTFFSLQTP